jgi:hypothetical protein
MRVCMLGDAQHVEEVYAWYFCICFVPKTKSSFLFFMSLRGPRDLIINWCLVNESFSWILIIQNPEHLHSFLPLHVAPI